MCCVSSCARSVVRVSTGIMKGLTSVWTDANQAWTRGWFSHAISSRLCPEAWASAISHVSNVRSVVAAMKPIGRPCARGSRSSFERSRVPPMLLASGSGLASGAEVIEKGVWMVGVGVVSSISRSSLSVDQGGDHR